MQVSHTGCCLRPGNSVFGEELLSHCCVIVSWASYCVVLPLIHHGGGGLDLRVEILSVKLLKEGVFQQRWERKKKKISKSISEVSDWAAFRKVKWGIPGWVCTCSVIVKYFPCAFLSLCCWSLESQTWAISGVRYAGDGIVLFPEAKVMAIAVVPGREFLLYRHRGGKWQW